MKLGIVINRFYWGNRLFDPNDLEANRDDCLGNWRRLRQKASTVGIEVGTTDAIAKSECDWLLYSDVCDDLPEKARMKSSFLLINESQLISKANWRKKNHDRFLKIFTWNDDYVDGIKYFKINPFTVDPIGNPREIREILKSRKYVMIARNKRYSGFGELYTERLRTISWFENHCPEEFDLYGVGWNEYVPRSRLARSVVSRVKPMKKLLSKGRRCYRGQVQRKKPILDMYKYAICYENSCAFPGYITEKIFDCFWSGCVPIYWGPPNVNNFIPKDCYIDRRVFDSCDDMHFFVSKIDEKARRKYIDSIIEYLESPMAKQFRSEQFADTILSHLEKATGA